MFVGCALVSSLSFDSFLQNTGIKNGGAALPPFPFAKGNMWTYGKEDYAQGQWGKGSIISTGKQLLLVLEGRDDKYLSGTGGLLQSGQYRLWLVEEVAFYCNFSCT